MTQNEVTFSFGENWKNYLDTVTEDEVHSAKRDIEEWLGNGFVSGKTVVDIGSGSGIHSLAFYLLGAKRIYSFDADPSSVEATKRLRTKFESPGRWTVSHGSILDKEFLQSLGQFDIAYSWGVLHHTGAMWEALEKSFGLVKPGGKLWVALYVKGPRYPKDLALKKRYNAASEFGKRWMIYQRIGKVILSKLGHFENPFAWNQKKRRGMNVYHNIVDWLGGLPYEVASENEVLKFGRSYGFILEEIKVKNEGGCSGYLFSLPK